MNPPLRTQADVQGVIEGLRDGTLDCVATDHAPHAAYEKDREFMIAPFGIHGLETSLALGITYLVKPGHLSLVQLVEKMATMPARILNLPGGTLGVGSSADVTVFSTETSWTVNADSFVSKGKNTPFGGWNLTGRTVATFVGGEQVFERSETARSAS